MPTYDKRLEVRTTTEQHAIITKNAKAAGLGLSDYVRENAINGGHIVINEAQAQNDEIVFQLVKIGTNLNQIAHAVNSGNHDFIEQRLMPLLDDLNAIKRRLFRDSESV